MCKLMPLARMLPLPGGRLSSLSYRAFQPRPDIPYSCLQNPAQNPDNYPGLEGLKARVAGCAPALLAHFSMTGEMCD